MGATVSFFCFVGVADQHWISNLLVREIVVFSERSALRACCGGAFCRDRYGARNGAEGPGPVDSSRGAAAVRTGAACGSAPADRRIYDRPACGVAVCKQC